MGSQYTKASYKTYMHMSEPDMNVLRDSQQTVLGGGGVRGEDKHACTNNDLTISDH